MQESSYGCPVPFDFPQGERTALAPLISLRANGQPKPFDSSQGERTAHKPFEFPLDRPQAT